MRKRQLRALILLTVALTGCGNMGKAGGHPAGEETEEAKTEGTQAERTQAEGTEAERTQAGETQTERAKAEGTQAEEAQMDEPEKGESGESPEKSRQMQTLLQGEICQGRIILEDEEALYICGTERIRRIEKSDGSSRVLWESGPDARDALMAMEGKGVLAGDYIYFLEEARREADGSRGAQGRCFSVIKKDGTGYERITELEDFPQAFYRCGNGLYLESNGCAGYYPEAEDGGPVRGEDREELSFEGLPGSYSLVYAMDSGVRNVSVLESLSTFGYYLAVNGGTTVAIDPKTGEERELMPEAAFRAFNRDFFLFGKYGEGKEELYLMDAESFETSLLAVYEKESYPYGVMVIDMDEEHVYVVAENAGSSREENSIYEEIDLKTGERRELFRLGKKPGMEGGFAFSARNVVIEEGYAYYADAMDYKMYLMRRSLSEPGEVAALGDAFYDSGISQVGTVESYFEEIHSQARPDFVLAEIDLERLVVDEKYKGAAKINRILAADQDSILSYAKDTDDLAWREDEIASQEEDEIPYNLSYSYSSHPSQITYFDGDRFSFYQQDYDYTGGAHGMPMWVGLTFDLNTGERLLLSDVLENSEEELREIVVRYFDACISEAPEEFWEDALTVVREGISLASDFYLEEEGICFYFHPYALAAYAGGFKTVTIPYEEFAMKIPVKNRG